MLDTKGNATENGMEFQRWGLIELPTALRASGDLNRRNGGLNCEKGVLNMYGMEGADLVAVLNERRHCTWYEPDADLSFADYARSRHDRREFQRRMWLDRGVFTVGGAAVGFFFSYVLPHLLAR